MRRNQLRNPPNVIQTDGIEFIEFTAPDASSLETALERLGFKCMADHRHKNVRLYRQNHLNFIVNAERIGQANVHAVNHGPSVNAIAMRVPDTVHALRIASDLNLEVLESTAGPMELNIPAIRAPDGCLLYLVDRYGSESIYDIDFVFRSSKNHCVPGLLFSVDHITTNVPKGSMVEHADFFKRTFGFTELQSFHIQGEHTGLRSIALVSPNGKIKLPINEPTDPQSQIAEFLEIHNGSGIQHIALSTPNIYRAVERCQERGTKFQSTPTSYYQRLQARNIPHHEDLSALQKHQVLIDGADDQGVLLQIFTQDMIGPLFFEIIQRKGNLGFGEGNFQALFESIEREQEQRGVFDEAV